MEDNDSRCLLCGELGCTKHPAKEKAARKFLVRLIYALAKAVFSLPAERLAGAFAAIQAMTEWMSEKGLLIKPQEALGAQIAITADGQVVVHRFGRQFQPVTEPIDPEASAAFGRVKTLAGQIREGIDRFEQRSAEVKRLLLEADEMTAHLELLVKSSHPFLGNRMLRSLQAGQPAGVKSPSQKRMLQAIQKKIEALRQEASALTTEAEHLMAWLMAEKETQINSEKAALTALESRNPRLFQLHHEGKMRITRDEPGSCQFFELREIDEYGEAEIIAGVNTKPAMGIVIAGQQLIQNHSAAELAIMIADWANKALGPNEAKRNPAKEPRPRPSAGEDGGEWPDPERHLRQCPTGKEQSVAQQTAAQLGQRRPNPAQKKIRETASVATNE